MLGLLLKTWLLGKVLEREAEEGVSRVSFGQTSVKGEGTGEEPLLHPCNQILLCRFSLLFLSNAYHVGVGYFRPSVACYVGLHCSKGGPMKRPALQNKQVSV